MISALPSYKLAEALEEGSDDSADGKITAELSRMLMKIDWVHVAVVHLEYEGNPEQVLPKPGFGHLVPAVEDSNILGVIYDSCAFPEHDRLVRSLNSKSLLRYDLLKDLFSWK